MLAPAQRTGMTAIDNHSRRTGSMRIWVYSTRMKVPLLDLKPQYLALKKDFDAHLAVCESQQFILGPAVKSLEADVGEIKWLRAWRRPIVRHQCAVDRVDGARRRSGDAVLTSPYTFFATAGTIARVGARPVVFATSTRQRSIFLRRQSRRSSIVISSIGTER
jgi:hypothetical protein